MSIDYNDGIRILLIFGQIFCLFMIFITIGVNMAQLESVNFAIFAEVGFGLLLLVLANVERLFYDTNHYEYRAVPQDIRGDDMV